jgi:hypothetical protein
MVTAIVLLFPANATELIIGNTPSDTKALLLAKEPDAPGVGNVNVALLLAASRIVPLFNTKALVLA